MRRTISAVAVALLGTVVGCSSDETTMMMEEPPDDGLLPGFEVEAPGPNEIQLLTPILPEIAPQEDVTLCTYLDYTTTEEFDVIHFRGFQSGEGHHAILYGANEAMPPGTHVCAEADMFNTRYLGGTGGADGAIAFDLPEGLAFRVHAGTQLMIQTHWINFSDQPVRGQAAFNIHKRPPTAGVDPSDLFADVTTQLALQPGPGSAHAQCEVQEPIKFFLLGGHAHEWGTRVSITVVPKEGTPEMIYDEAWGPEKVFDSKLNWYTKEQPLMLAAGDRLDVDCVYENTTGEALYFPSEMCVAFGYYFPATRQLNCVDNVWPGL